MPGPASGEDERLNRLRSHTTKLSEVTGAQPAGSPVSPFPSFLTFPDETERKRLVLLAASRAIIKARRAQAADGAAAGSPSSVPDRDPTRKPRLVECHGARGKRKLDLQPQPHQYK